jgi:hypothetical protein
VQRFLHPQLREDKGAEQVFHREAFIFPRKSPKSAGPSKNYHLMLAMGEQDAITPLASGANQGPDILKQDVS